MEQINLQSVINIPQQEKTVNAVLDNLFPEQANEEKQLKKVKEILGDLATLFTTEQLRDVTAEIQFLTNSWLDDFERDIFHGLTLQELLHEKGA